MCVLILSELARYPLAESQREVECLTSCGSDASILGVETFIGQCCSSAAAFNIPADPANVGCQSCDDYRSELYFAHYISYDGLPILFARIAIHYLLRFHRN